LSDHFHQILDLVEDEEAVEAEDMEVEDVLADPLMMKKT
jgi:hypothetical protein